LPIVTFLTVILFELDTILFEDSVNH
jgi:hypothetical protein